MPAKKQRKSAKTEKTAAKHSHSFAGLVFGVLAMLGCWIPVLGTLLSIVAILMARKGGVMNGIGCVLGIIALLLSLLFLGAFVVLFGLGFFAGKVF